MAAVIKIKSTAANGLFNSVASPASTTLPAGLALGELAYSFSNNTLVIGTGTSSSNVIIGGAAYMGNYDPTTSTLQNISNIVGNSGTALVIKGTGTNVINIGLTGVDTSILGTLSVLQTANISSLAVTNASTFSGVTSFSYANGIGFKDVQDTASSGASPSYFLKPPATDLTSATGIKTFLLPIIAGTTNTSTDSLVSLTSTDILTNKTWNSAVIGATYGGTGVNNGSNTITLVGNFATAGASAITLTATAATNVTLPTTGTLATTAYVDSVAQGLHVHPPADVILLAGLSDSSATNSLLNNRTSYAYANDGQSITINSTTNNLTWVVDGLPIFDIDLITSGSNANGSNSLTITSFTAASLVSIPAGTPISGSGIAPGTLTTTAFSSQAAITSIGLSKATTSTISTSTTITVACGWTRIVITGESSTTASTTSPNTEWHGIYTRGTITGTVPNAVSQIILNRAADANILPELSGGDFIFIQRGLTFADTGFVQSVSTILTTAWASDNGFKPMFLQFSQAGVIAAGNGLTKSGTTLDVVGTLNRISVAADSIDIASTYIGQGSITTVGNVSSGTIDGGSF